MKNNNEYLKALQNNLTQLIRLYDDSKPGAASTSEEIRRLEQENQQLNEQLRASKAAAVAAVTATSLKTSTSFSSSPMQQMNAFGDVPSSADDPFQTVDPFSSTTAGDNDPFKSTSAVVSPVMGNGFGSNGGGGGVASPSLDQQAGFDPFGTFDPFGDKIAPGHTNGATNGNHAAFDAFDADFKVIISFFFKIFI